MKIMQRKRLGIALGWLLVGSVWGADVTIRFTDPFGKPEDPDGIQFRILDRAGAAVPIVRNGNGTIVLETGDYVLELVADYVHRRTPFAVSRNSDAVTVMVQAAQWSHLHRLRGNQFTFRCTGVLDDGSMSVKVIHIVTGEIVERKVRGGGVTFSNLPDGRYLALTQKMGEPVGEVWVSTNEKGSPRPGTRPCRMEVGRK